MHYKLVKCASVNQGWLECLSQPRQALFSPQAEKFECGYCYGRCWWHTNTKANRYKGTRSYMLEELNSWDSQNLVLWTFLINEVKFSFFCFWFFTFRCVGLAQNQCIQLHSENNPITSQRRVQWVAYCQWIATLCISLWRFVGQGKIQHNYVLSLCHCMQ